MEYKKYINKIMAGADEKKVAEMTEYLCELIDMVNDSELDKVEQKLYEIAEGKILNEDKAREIITKMKPSGKKWELADTEAVRTQYGYENIRPVDFWIVMNMAFNDYEDLFKDNVDYYAKFSKDFIMDEDAIDNKIYCYFMKISK